MSSQDATVKTTTTKLSDNNSLPFNGLLSRSKAETFSKYIK